jgi:thiopeptide-type bacteriocin biosynthesis protein
MHNIELGSNIFIRAAEKSYVEFDYKNLKFDLKNKDFQAAIFFASESLFNELKKHEFIYEALSERTVFSLRKYYNRVHFRATPFALFASVGLIKWGEKTNILPQIISREISIFPDFQIMYELSRLDFLNNKDDQIYFTNKTIYNAKTGYRYLHFDFAEDSQSAKFKISSFQNSALLKKLLKHALSGRTKQQLMEDCMSYGGEYHDSKYFVEYLISSGILYAELLPNYVGNSYYHKLNAAIEQKGAEFKDNQNWAAAKQFFRRYETQETIPLSELMKINWPEVVMPIKNKFYVNSYIQFDLGMEKKYQKNVLEGLKCLDSLSLVKKIPSLNDFKERFKKKFESREIPFLQALDPEIGIGYLSLEEGINNNSILENLAFKKEAAPETNEWLPIHKLLLKKLYHSKPYQPISFDDQDLDHLPQDNLAYPPSFSVQFTIYDDYISIENAGGCSATALTGRFTLNNELFKCYNLEIAQKEQAINKDVIFAEVSCFIKGQAANVCTRESAYNYEIPILVNSEINRANIISPADLYISIVNDEIILRSKRLKKNIIPRFTSAYNFNHHDLAPFRFLCDLQYQSIKTDFNLNLQQLLPGLSFYPRVVYKSCILYRATWILDEKQLNKLINNKEPVLACAELFEKLLIPIFFIIVEHDNSLFFNSKSKDDILMFIHVLKSKSSVTIKEVLISKKYNIINRNHAPLIHELVTPIFNTSPSYSNPTLLKTITPNKIKRIHPPADEWLYYKIYSHTQISDDILGNELHLLIKKLIKKNLIQQWFFIRYKDPEDHLRLRFKIKIENIAAAMSLFNNALNKRIANGSISTIILDTYKKEIERYSAENIDLMESVFYKSSCFVMDFLYKRYTGKTEYSVFETLIASIDAIIDQYDSGIAKKEEFTKEMSQKFGKEFFFDQDLKYQLNTKYRKTRSQIDHCLLPKNRAIILSAPGKEYLRIIKTALMAAPQKLKVKLLADIIHMHVNRMLNENQRKQEFILYYLISMQYHSVKNRNKTY